MMLLLLLRRNLLAYIHYGKKEWHRYIVWWHLKNRESDRLRIDADINLWWNKKYLEIEMWLGILRQHILLVPFLYVLFDCYFLTVSPCIHIIIIIIWLSNWQNWIFVFCFRAMDIRYLSCQISLVIICASSHRYLMIK